MWHPTDWRHPHSDDGLCLLLQLGCRGVLRVCIFKVTWRRKKETPNPPLICPELTIHFAKFSGAH